jgi:hypothetical protein
MPLLHVHVIGYFIFRGSLILPNNDLAVAKIIKPLGLQVFGCLVCRRRLRWQTVLSETLYDTFLFVFWEESTMLYSPVRRDTLP